MKKLILLTAISLILTACGSDSAKNTTKNANKDAINTASTETTSKVAVAPTVTPEPAVPATTAAIDKQAAVVEAKVITKAFATELKSELQAAMKAGGPINALEVCNTKATLIAEKAAKEHNALVSRVSLKNRNPANIPNDWQKVVLGDFDARTEKGEDVDKMAFAKVVEQNDKKQLRFMKALPTGGLCLTCHGSNIDAGLQTKLDALYPEDKAVGYELGQVRGAIVVIKDLN